MPKENNRNNKSINLPLKPIEIGRLLEWYGAAHHFRKCNAGVKDCHNLKTKLWEALRVAAGVKKGAWVKRRY